MHIPTPAYTLVKKDGFYSVSIHTSSESAEAMDVTADREKALRLFSVLEENTVFPENLYEILDDLLGVEIW